MKEEKPAFYYTEVRAEMLPFVPETAKTILEVGCGEGTFASALKKRNKAEVWGIELDEQSGQQAAQVIDKVLVGDASALAATLPEKYFDAIVFNDVLEHLLDPYSLLSSLKANLRPGGVIVSSIPNIRYFRALIDIVWKQQWKYADFGTFDRTHFRFFTQQSIADMYTDAGYKVVKMQGINASKSIRPFLFNLLALGKLSDSKYLQFATVATPAGDK